MSTQTIFRHRRVPTLKSGFRPDIQALRAIAVFAVVFNHLWPQRVSGGYVGVDIFFVISGFLITSHLSKEAVATGRIKLSAFYARRIRRLLPAALLVLLAGLLLTYLFAPYTFWTRTAQEVLGSALYFENWLLAIQSVDYFAVNSSATVAQHYWSLSVEEQFYLVWPWLLILAAFLARKSGLRSKLVLLWIVVLITLVSFGVSIGVTQLAPQQAYFITPVRAWEFGVGGLLALAQPWIAKFAVPYWARLTLQSSAVLALLISFFRFDGNTPFPGWAALLPVLGTAVLIGVGVRTGPRTFLDGAFGLKPVQFLGNISYSIYLWHWPLIVILPFVLAAPLSFMSRILVLLLTIFLAWLSKKFIEDRWIRRENTSIGNFRAYLSMTSAIVVIGLACGTVMVQADQRAIAASQLAETKSGDTCYGVNAVTNSAICGDPFAAPVTAPDMGPDNAPYPFPEECSDDPTALPIAERETVKTCIFSSPGAPSENVWLVGDSHAQQWQKSVLGIAKQEGWTVRLRYLSACPLADVDLLGYRGKASDSGTVAKCKAWSNGVSDEISRARPDKVFTGTFFSGEQIDDGSGASQLEQYSTGLQKYWQRWIDAGATVYPIIDPPLNAPPRDKNCLLQSADYPGKCAVPLTEGLSMDPMTSAAKELNNQNIKIVDLTKFFCDESRCFASVGGVSLYYDPDHLNGKIVAQLLPEFRKAAGL